MIDEDKSREVEKHLQDARGLRKSLMDRGHRMDAHTVGCLMSDINALQADVQRLQRQIEAIKSVRVS